MAAEYQFSIADILFVLRRRAPVLAACFVAVFGVILIVAIILPPVYQSGGIILVESQQVPTEFVQSTVTTIADERIQVIKQRVMTRDNLYRIIEQYQLFKNESSSLTVSEMLERMRGMIAVEPVVANVDQRGRKAQTIAFRVSFEHRSPFVANKVANELITLFLSENARSRTERANETADFLTREAEKLQGELNAVEKRVADFKERHENALPEHLAMRTTMLQRAEEELRSVTHDLIAAQEERRLLELELMAARNGVSPGQSNASPGFELEELKTQYRVLAAKYQEAHPDLRALRERIKAAEQALADSAAGQDEDKIITPAGLRLAEGRAKFEALGSRIDALTAQQKKLRQRIEQVEAGIVRTPQTERELAVLMRDYENVKRKFEEVKAKEVDAKMAKSLEEESKAERFSLLEPPSVPEQPVKPDRNRIALMGFFAAIGSSGGVVFLLEMLAQRVWGAALLTYLVRQPPLVVIPYITTAEELVARKRAIRRVLTIAGASLVLVLACVHFLFMPLDIIWMKILTRW